MHYLEATISENLRMFPPATESDRNCTQDCTGGKKVLYMIYSFFFFFLLSLSQYDAKSKFVKDLIEDLNSKTQLRR
jgi:hypothetical protein